MLEESGVMCWFLCVRMSSSEPRVESSAGFLVVAHNEVANLVSSCLACPYAFSGPLNGGPDISSAGAPLSTVDVRRLSDVWFVLCFCHAH